MRKKTVLMTSKRIPLAIALLLLVVLGSCRPANNLPTRSSPQYNELVRTFSAGMQRRLALARVLLRRPRLILLDEPYAAFDAEGIACVNAILAEHKAAGGAAIVATHDPVRAAQQQQIMNRAKSLQALVDYCEATNRCRHRIIAGYFADEEVPPCDFACDWCKDAEALVRRKEKGLASEEWCSTQREMGRYEGGYDEYD